MEFFGVVGAVDAGGVSFLSVRSFNVDRIMWETWPWLGMKYRMVYRLAASRNVKKCRLPWQDMGVIGPQMSKLM